MRAAATPGRRWRWSIASRVGAAAATAAAAGEVRGAACCRGERGLTRLVAWRSVLSGRENSTTADNACWSVDEPSLVWLAQLKWKPNHYLRLDVFWASNFSLRNIFIFLL